MSLAVQQIILAASLVHLLTATAIPIAIGLITKLSAPPKIKVPVTLLLTMLGTFVVKATVKDGTAVISVGSLVTFAELYAMQLAVFLGIIRPLGVRNALAPTQGIG